KYIDVIKQGLQAMDTTAVTLCMENNIPIVCFALNEKDSIVKVVSGEKIGTLIH
ncbi:MAG: UMP kinase, partial [Clostridia bacterium]